MVGFRFFVFWIVVFIAGSSALTSLWAMDEALRGECRRGLMNGDGAVIVRGLQKRLRAESIDSAGDAMIEALQASNFQVDPKNPRPRPEINRPEIRALWEEVTQGKLAERSLFIQRMNEAEQRRQEAAPETNLLTIGRLIPKVISTQFRVIPKGVYFIGKSGKDREGNPNGMWVRVKTDFYVQRGLVSRAQFLKVMGYDPVIQFWRGQTEQRRQINTRRRDTLWRQATQIPEEELGNYPATFVSAEQTDAFVQSLGVEFRLPTEWEQSVYMHAGQRSEIICDENSENRLHETGEMESNHWDIHNALGNASQWSGSICMPLTYPETTKETPIDIDELAARNPSTGWSRVYCGSSWINRAPCSNQSGGFRLSGSSGNEDLGFRVLRIVEE